MLYRAVQIYLRHGCRSTCVMDASACMFVCGAGGGGGGWVGDKGLGESWWEGGGVCNLFR